MIEERFDEKLYCEDELLDQGEATYAAIREQLNNRVPLALHKASHGGKVAYLGFVNGAGNIPQLVQALCMGINRSSLS